MTPWHLVVTDILYIWPVSLSVCDSHQTPTSSQDIKKGPVPSVYPPAALMPLTGWENVRLLGPPNSTGLGEYSTVGTGPRELLSQALLSPEHRTATLPGQGQRKEMGKGTEGLLPGTHTSLGPGCQFAGGKQKNNAAFRKGRQRNWKSPLRQVNRLLPRSLKSGFHP